MLRSRSYLVSTLCSLASVSVLVVSTALAGDAYDKSIATSKAARRVDIVGLKLGMTVEQVRAVIERHDARLASNVKVNEGTLKRADGTTRAFTWRLHAERYGEEGHDIQVVFTNPPRQTRAVGITRTRLFPLKKREPYADVRKALLAQYGKPTRESRVGAKPGKKVDLEGPGGGLALEWKLDEGKTECMKLEIGRSAPRPKSVGEHQPKDCSAQLAAWIIVDYGKVSRVTTTLVDPGLAAVTQTEYQALVQKERKKASVPKKDEKPQSL